MSFEILPASQEDLLPDAHQQVMGLRWWTLVDSLGPPQPSALLASQWPAPAQWTLNSRT